MITIRYHAPTAGTLVTRGNKSVLLKDVALSITPPENLGLYEEGCKSFRKIDDYGMEVDWGEHEETMWEWFKENGTETKRQETGTEAATLAPDSERSKQQ